MGMRAQFVIPVLASILILGTIAIIPAMAVSASRVIISINPSDRHGVIERTDDSSGTLYQFNIPRDVNGAVELGDNVDFTVEPENSRHATNVICTSPCNAGK